MAIYHCSGTVINRSSSRSSVSSSAYISGNKIVNERDGLIHDYTRKKGVTYSEVMLCENAPKEWEDSKRLWNEVEKVENGNGQPCRIIEVALPRELDTKENIELAREYVRETFVKKGMCAEFAIHNKKDGNPHAHIMLTMRPVDENGKWENKTEKVYICKDHQGQEKEFTARELKASSGEWEKQLPYYKNGNAKSRPVYLTKYEKEHEDKYKDYERVKGKNNPKKSREDRVNPKVAEWNSEEAFKEYRKSLATVTNKHLERKQLNIRIDHRSYEEQKKNRVPTIHIGSYANQMEKRGIKTDRGNINREIKLTNEQIEKITRDINDTILERAKLSRKIKEQEKEVGQTDSFKEQVFTSKMTPLEQEEAAREMIKCEDTYALLEESKSMSVEELDRAKESYEDTSKEYNKLQQHLSIIKEYRKSYKKLEEEREGLGVFKFAQKKELDRKMAEIDEYKNREYDEIEKETDGKIKGYKQLKERLQDQENKLNRTKDEISNLEDRLNKIQREQKQLGQKYCHLEEKFNKTNVSSKEVMSKLRQQSKEQQHKADVKEQIQVIKTIQQEKKAPTKHKVKNIDRDR